jgi:hypothetical protein
MHKISISIQKTFILIKEKYIIADILMQEWYVLQNHITNKQKFIHSFIYALNMIVSQNNMSQTFFTGSSQVKHTFKIFKQNKLKNTNPSPRYPVSYLYTLYMMSV